MLASREDLRQSDPQSFPSQFQEQLNQGYENDEFPSGKDSWRKNKFCWLKFSALHSAHCYYSDNRRSRVYNPS